MSAAADTLFKVWLIEVDGEAIGWNEAFIHADSFARANGGKARRVTMALDELRALAPYAF